MVLKLEHALESCGGFVKIQNVQVVGPPLLRVSEFMRPALGTSISVSNKLLRSDADAVPGGPHFENH